MKIIYIIFDQFQADDSHTGEQCPVCLKLIETGTKLVNLKCDGKHILCNVCTAKWFGSNNTCPACRAVFVSFM